MYIRTFLEEKHMDNADVYADVMLGLTIADVYVVVGPYAFCRRSFTNVKGYPHANLKETFAMGYLHANLR